MLKNIKNNRKWSLFNEEKSDECDGQQTSDFVLSLNTFT